MDIFRPESPNGICVIIVPGGAYQCISYENEGRQVAFALNKAGVTAFLLEYRLAPYQFPIPLQDGLRAIRIVRNSTFGCKYVGVLGFSAGGHLASMLETLFDQSELDLWNRPINPVLDFVSPKIDFLGLIYPVISMEDSWTHRLSRSNLLGSSPNSSFLQLTSTHYHVHTNQILKISTPPTFLVHSLSDVDVSYQNTEIFFTALRNQSIPVEKHYFQQGGHGYGIQSRTRRGGPAPQWISLFVHFLLGFL